MYGEHVARPRGAVRAEGRLGVQIKDIGSGNFGIARLMKDTVSSELVAVKFIERGEKVRAPMGRPLACPPSRCRLACTGSSCPALQEPAGERNAAH